MVKYICESESSSYSRFLLYSKTGSIYMLCFDKSEAEEIFYDDDFLQENISEMTIAKVSKNNDNCCKDVADNIKTVFDSILNKYSNQIIYISISTNSPKEYLIKRFISEDLNSNYYYLSFSFGGLSFYFFFNDKKINIFQALESLIVYFKKEYGANFTAQHIFKIENK